MMDLYSIYPKNHLKSISKIKIKMKKLILELHILLIFYLNVMQNQKLGNYILIFGSIQKREILNFYFNKVENLDQLFYSMQ